MGQQVSSQQPAAPIKQDEFQGINKSKA